MYSYVKGAASLRDFKFSHVLIGLLALSETLVERSTNATRSEKTPLFSQNTKVDFFARARRASGLSTYVEPFDRQTPSLRVPVTR